LISLTDTEKVNAIAQLEEEEPARTEILNRFIANATTAQRSTQKRSTQQTDDVEGDDAQIHDDDVSEDGAEDQETDESVIDNVEAVRDFMTSIKPFQRLREDMCLLAFPDSRELIRAVLDGSETYLNDSDIATITCHARWEVLACCEAELQDLQRIAQTVTFTGNSRLAQAASCAEYLRRTWPRTGDAMMRVFCLAITHQACSKFECLFMC